MLGLMWQDMFEGEALGEFYVENRPHPLAGTIRLKNGASPELTLVGHLTDDWLSRVTLSTEPPTQDFLWGENSATGYESNDGRTPRGRALS